MGNLVSSSIKKCSNCGGNLVFSPSFQELVCANCASQSKIDKSKEYQKHGFEKVENAQDKVAKFSGYAKCSNCGANVNLDDNISGVCPYCNTAVVAVVDDKDLNEPDFVVPFAFNKERASELFLKNVKKKWFLPNKFKKTPQIDKINGYYFPVCSFDENTRSTYSGKLAVDHHHTDSNGRTYTTTSYHNISGEKQLSFTDIMTESSSRLTQDELQKIMPYDTRECYKFNKDFLRGYSLEYPNESAKELKNVADNIIDMHIKNEILAGYRYDRVSYLNIETIRADEKYSFGALPVYEFTLDYKNKPYKTLVNGQTGQIGGGLPKSKTKIAMLIIGILLVIGGIALLVALGEGGYLG